MSDQSFLDYDNYKKNIKNVWDKIDDAVDKDEDDFDDADLVEEDLNYENSSDDSDVSVGKDKDNKVEDKDDKVKDKKTIKSFPDSLRFVQMPLLGEDKDYKEGKSSTSYSKSEILKIVSNYIEDNLDEDTDILVTVEYEDVSSNVEKIILQTQSSVGWGKKSYILTSDDYDKYIDEDSDDKDLWNIVNKGDEEAENKNTATVSNREVNKSSSSQKATSTQKTTSSKLTSKEQKEAEEIFSILF